MHINPLPLHPRPRPNAAIGDAEFFHSLAAYYFYLNYYIMSVPTQAYIPDTGITPTQVAFYREHGYLVGRQLLRTEEIDALRDETLAIFRGERAEIPGVVAPVAGASPAEILGQYIAIHFPHKVSPLVREYLGHARITDVLTQLVSPNVKCMQSMLFVKAPGKPGQSWHQDEYFIPTRDQSLIGAWIAVDDAAVENGCLWVIPGSHKEGYLRRRLPYRGDQYGDKDVCDLAPYTEDDAVPVEVPSGSVVFFHGYLLHSSRANRTKDRFRTALVNHYMSAESQLPWNQDGRLPDSEDMRDVILVAGRDPYEHKGTTDVSRPFLRASQGSFQKKEQ